MKMIKNQPITEEIYRLLNDLGIKGNTICFFHTAQAVRIAAEDPQKLRWVTKALYPEVAEQFNAKWPAVERNIRRLIDMVWKDHPDKLEALAGKRLDHRPTPVTFLTIMVNRIHSSFPA